MADPEQTPSQPSPTPTPDSGAAPAPVPAAGGGDVLSQADIDRMMAEASSSSTAQPPVFRANGDRFAEAERPQVEAHDFANPVVIDEHLLRVLKQRHEEFAAFVAARLSIFLRMDFNLKLQRIASLSYRRFTALVPNPSHVVLFKMEPLAGVGVLDVDCRLGLSLVERMLGGKGLAAQVPDSLSEIELNLLDDLLLVVLEEWCRQWGPDRKLTPAVVGHESGGRYLQTSASDTAMLLVAFEGAFGETTGRLQMAIPFASVDGILRGLVAARLPVATETARPKRQSAWRSAFNGIPIPLSVEWDACELSLREIVALAPGSVLRLSRDVLRDTRVRLTGSTKFVGEVGVEDGRLAVRIDEKISPEEK